MTSKSKKEPRLKIQLLKCTKPTCSHIFTSDEYGEIPWPGQPSGKLLVCPACKNDSTYTVDRSGRITEQGTTVNAHDIEPSPRMGTSMRQRILAAKRRAIARAGA